MKQSPVISCFWLALLVCYEVSASPFVGVLEQWDTGDLAPYDIAVRSDGTAWVTQRHHFNPDGPRTLPDEGRVFTVDPATGILTVRTAAASPARFQTVDVAPDDTLWLVSNHPERNSIFHFDPDAPGDAQFTAYDLPETVFPSLPAYPFGIRVATDGKVWFTCWDDPAIGSFDPTTETFERFPLPAGGDRSPGVPMEIDFDIDGNVWFTIREQGAGLAGVGHLDLTTGDFKFALGGNFFPLDPRRPWNIKVLQVPPPPAATAYPSVWFVDKTTNYLVRFDAVPGTPSIDLEEMDADLFDSHYFVLDVDGDGAMPRIVWLAALGPSLIGTYEPGTDTYSRLHLPGAGPMGIGRTASGTIWWAEDGYARGSGGIGRFTRHPDPDEDGIPDLLDTDPGVPSNDFDDGVTAGSAERGDQALSFIELPNPLGVRILASCDGGPVPAQITASCDPPVNEELNACEDATVTCGSANVRVQVGPVDVTLDGNIFAIVPTGGELTVHGSGEEVLELKNSGATAAITISYSGRNTELLPGEKMHLGQLIDIWPGFPTNLIRRFPTGRMAPAVLPVAVLSSPGLNAPHEVDTESITFGVTGDEKSLHSCFWWPRDVNRDGLPDLECLFFTNRAGFRLGDTVGVLKARTFDGELIEHRDDVTILSLGAPRR